MTEKFGHRECDRFYRASMEALQKAGVPFMVGGAYAFGVYTGISRDTKDFDLFIRPQEVDRTISVLTRIGYQAERTFPHWLAKVKRNEDVIDLIYRAGNGLCEVDESWLRRARDGELLGMSAKLCAPEEILWMKAFIMERERYDGADVMHLIQSCGQSMDWDHLVARFGPDWRLLLSYLILFGYVYPGERDQIPDAVLGRLVDRLRTEPPPSDTRICRGTLLSRQQYLPDVEQRGLRDARLEQRVKMNGDDIARWTEAIKRDGNPQN